MLDSVLKNYFIPYNITGIIRVEGQILWTKKIIKRVL